MLFPRQRDFPEILSGDIFKPRATHCTLHATHCTLHATHCTPHDTRYTLNTDQDTCQTTHWTLHTVQDEEKNKIFYLSFLSWDKQWPPKSGINKVKICPFDGQNSAQISVWGKLQDIQINWFSAAVWFVTNVFSERCRLWNS